MLLAPGSAALAGPPPAVIELDARVRPVVPLPGHAQLWIHSGGQLDIDAVARQGDALDWRPVLDEARYPLTGRCCGSAFVRTSSRHPSAGSSS